MAFDCSEMKHYLRVIAYSATCNIIDIIRVILFASLIKTGTNLRGRCNDFTH